MRITDRVRISVGKTVFIVGPLSQNQKIELSECTRIDHNGDPVYDLTRAQTLLVKYGLKDIEGVTDGDDEPYKLELVNGVLSDDCVSEIFTLEEKSLYVQAAWQVLNNIPDKLTDPVSGKKLKGVSLARVGKKKAEK
jgi:hypothetical protein